MSSLYETAPVGGPDQDPYLNAVGFIDTALSAEELLAALHAIEAEAGRVRGERWGPRTLDLDLIIYDELSRDTPALQVPHPRASERRFVLAPLVEVWPDAQLGSGSAREALDKLTGQHVVRLAADWREGVPQFIDRGGRWVAGQALLLAIWAVLFVATGSFPPRDWGWAGLVPVVIGLFMVLAAIPALGDGLTPFPVPSRSGRLVTTGPYGLVRHPIYGGILLVVLGLSVLGGSWWAAGAAMVLGILFFLKSGHEERFLRVAYSDYSGYSGAVPKRLIPGII